VPKPLSRRELLSQLLRAAGGLVVSGGTAGCAPTPTSEPTPSTPVLITILHVNDLHGALLAKSEAGGTRGGAAELVGLIDRRRSAARGPVLLLDAGDAFQGTYISNMNHGEAMVDVMNLAGVDAMTLGNHEFDWGLDVLRARIQQARFPFLAANLEAESEAMLEGVLPYTVLDADGVKVGVLGLTYHDLATIVLRSAIEGLRSLPPAESVRRYLPELGRVCDVIIVLSHLGPEGDRELARAIPDIAVIVGSHSHQVLPRGERVGDTVIVQAGTNGYYLGELIVHFDRAGNRIADIDRTGEVLKVTADGTPNAQVSAIVDKWQAAASQAGSKVIGQTAIALRAARGEETALGNLITDAMRAADLGDGKRSDIGLHNDGGIRADLDAGPITYAELYAVLPFDNTLVGIDLTGAQVKDMLEQGINDSASEIQVSGLSFTYTMARGPGQRVTQVLVNDRPLDNRSTYRLVTINYLHTHTQYARSLGKGTNVTFGPLCLDAVSDFISARSPVRPQVEGRIQRR
jgi:2',3'-cyclic-nucleotide 2'-phosphodiesterase (5'-nucleotidase family)